MPANKNTNVFSDFFNSEKMGGLLLIVCTVASIAIANSSIGNGYLHFWHSHVGLPCSKLQLNYPVGEWVNDGLMAIFFLLVGLEIERELYIGELSDFKSAMLPVVAAIGGMAVPALLHFLFNHGTATQSGIGIPMATDIAFALGILSLAGNKVPASVKIFLAALAIIDDLGAVVVIALFYTKELSLLNLSIAFSIFILLLAFNKMKIKKLLFYLIPGIAMWYFMLRSGVHATVSGILLAFAIPFDKEGSKLSEKVQHFLHKPVAFLVLPIFALANTGIVLAPGWQHTLISNNSTGIIAGLFLGKPIGILLFCFAAIKLRLSNLPQGMRWGHLSGVGALAGIGFTMSIFITNLAFDDAGLVQNSKIAILTASMLAGLFGFALLKWACKKHPSIHASVENK
ncbi:MAG: Na+/H+ antiporter NhaA [Bacteroidetes bacterium]|nr:Na+/H+ antiporter NhaA [Bacteroidota bacterium]MBS1975534.1 Na+/H+ antiporter NhaA [Bacteroidota bacterium]